MEFRGLADHVHLNDCLANRSLEHLAINTTTRAKDRNLSTGCAERSKTRPEIQQDRGQHVLEHVWSREENEAMPPASHLPPDNTPRVFVSDAITAQAHQPRPSPTQVCSHTDITDGGDYRLHVEGNDMTDTDHVDYSGMWFSW